MLHTQPLLTKIDKIPAEYKIYAYHNFSENLIGHNKWQCLSIHEDKNLVLEQAQRFFETQKFEKIEIKKKIFDPKSKRHKVSTLRVLDNQPKKNLIFIIFGLLVLMALAGLFFLEIF